MIESLRSKSQTGEWVEQTDVSAGADYLLALISGLRIYLSWFIYTFDYAV